MENIPSRKNRPCKDPDVPHKYNQFSGIFYNVKEPLISKMIVETRLSPSKLGQNYLAKHGFLL